MIFTNRKFVTVLIGGIIMPVFLLGAPAEPAVSAETEIDIVFAGRGGIAAYDLSDPVFLFKTAGGADTYKAKATEAVVLRMRQDPAVEYVEIDAPITAARVTTDDPFFTTNDLDEDNQWYLDRLKLPQAWDYGLGSANIKVAVVDTGIHARHLELNDGRVVGGYNVISGAPIPADSNSDDNGHGTAVAGVIGAIPDNGRGIAGINWKISLVPVKALSADGKGTISDVSAGIVWAADNGADIINLSLGGAGFGNDQTLNNAIIWAYGKGAVIVSAAGNDLADQGVNLDNSPVYPICADGGSNMVIGVAATDINDQKATFSNFGINCVDITAPGRRILTTAFLPSENSNNVLIYGSGTSLAAPMVSGVAALLKANNPLLTNTQIKDIILRTADNIDALNQKNCLGGSCNGFLGSGRLNALSALSPQPLLDGTLVRELSSGNIYLITGGKKSLVTEFVFNRNGYAQDQVVNDVANELRNMPNGPPVAPPEGLLIKTATDATVYYTHQGVKRPLTFLVFQSRRFSFADVITVPEFDLRTIPIGEWYWPPDGVMVLIKDNPTVYVMDNAVKRPVTYFVFTQRRLSFASVVLVTEDEFSHIPKPPDSYWLPPLDGTLVKSDSDHTVYVIVDGARRALTLEAFQARQYNFQDIKILPQAEIEVIAPGVAIKN